jgi:hypothetical protein
MRFADLVATAGAVAAAQGRRRKVALIADLLIRLGRDEVAVGAGLLAGGPLQGRLGVGWQTLESVEAIPAAEPSLELLDVDRALDDLAAATGPGSRQQRLGLLGEVFGRATVPEQRYLRGVLLGELRQGALEGVLTQAIAAAWGLDEAPAASTETSSCWTARRWRCGPTVAPRRSRTRCAAPPCCGRSSSTCWRSAESTCSTRRSWSDASAWLGWSRRRVVSPA